MNKSNYESNNERKYEHTILRGILALVCRIFAEPLEMPFGPITLFLIEAFILNNHYKNHLSKCIHFLVCLLLGAIVVILKHFIHSKRPYDIEPKSFEWFDTFLLSHGEPNDMPSGHSAFGTYYGIVLLLSGNYSYSFFMLLQPILRVVGYEHTLMGASFGTFIGILFFIVEYVLLKNIKLC